MALNGATWRYLVFPDVFSPLRQVAPNGANWRVSKNIELLAPRGAIWLFFTVSQIKKMATPFFAKWRQRLAPFGAISAKNGATWRQLAFCRTIGAISANWRFFTVSQIKKNGDAIFRQLAPTVGTIWRY